MAFVQTGSVGGPFTNTIVENEDDGYAVGYAEGESAGLIAGYATGYATGYSDGDTAGQATGYATGYSAGDTAGQTTGYATGYAVGYTAGDTAGQITGYAAGYSAGNIAGQATGYATGYAAGDAADDIVWVPITQALINTGTKYVGSVTDTQTSLTESGGIVTGVCNTIAGTADGHRKTSGIGIPILNILPGLNFNLHNILVWMVNPVTGGPSASACMAVALVINPGPSGNGAGVLVTSSQRRAQSLSTTITAGAVVNTDAFSRFICSHADASGEIAVSVFRVGTSSQIMQSSVSAAVDLSNAANIKLYIQSGSYTGAVVATSFVSSKIYVAAVPKVAHPL